MKIFSHLATLLTIGSGSGDIHNVSSAPAASTIANTLNVIYSVAGTVAVIVIIIAGYVYVTSGGKPANIAKAKDTILYAVVGIAVILLAFVITRFVVGRF